MATAKQKETQTEAGNTGIVVGITRRYAAVLVKAVSANTTASLQTADQRIAHVHVPGRMFNEIAIGDQVEISGITQGDSITSIIARKNHLSRTYGERAKSIAANLDLLLLVTAVTPLFNSYFVDRVLTVAHTQNIPVLLVLNKADLGLKETTELLAVYQKLELPILITSALTGSGLPELKNALANPALQNIALAGISGVGKSTILNALIPEAQQRTATVSKKTGLGRQTTSMAYGFQYPRPDDSVLLLIDLPGIQSFGVSNLTNQQIIDSFPEFNIRRGECEYLDCWHKAEPNCAVKESLAAGNIAKSRYESYLKMLQEVADAKEY